MDSVDGNGRARQGERVNEKGALIPPVVCRVAPCVVVIGAVLLSAGFWIRSFTHKDHIGFERHATAGEVEIYETLILGSHDGRLGLYYYRTSRGHAEFFKATGVWVPVIRSFRAAPSPLYPAPMVFDTRPISERTFAGIQWGKGRVGYPGSSQDGWAVAVPFWLVQALLTCAGFVVLRKFLVRRRRTTDGGSPRCEKCGYDLRAGHMHCPECGVICDVGTLPGLIAPARACTAPPRGSSPSR